MSCTFCPNGSADKYQATISGVTEVNCGSCASFNKTFTLDRVGGCQYDAQVSPSACTYTGLTLMIGMGTMPNTAKFTLSLVGGGPIWTKDNITDCLTSHTLTGGGAPLGGCNWPTSVSIAPLNAPLPDPTPPPCGCCQCAEDGVDETSQHQAGDQCTGTEDATNQPVRFANGELRLPVTDIAGAGFGLRWGHTRIYSNRLSASYDFGNGWNWLVSQRPYIQKDGANAVCVVRSPDSAVWFDLVMGSYVPRHGAKHSLVHDTMNNRRSPISNAIGRWVILEENLGGSSKAKAGAGAVVE